MFFPPQNIGCYEDILRFFSVLNPIASEMSVYTTTTSVVAIWSNTSPETCFCSQRLSQSDNCTVLNNGAGSVQVYRTALGAANKMAD